MTADKICRDCGAQFKRSPADTTVRCPDCRANRTHPDDVKRCVVCDNDRYISSRRASTGQIERTPCYRCNPA
jgi:hypothetical protein